MRLLLVDDHPLFTEGLRNLLVAHGLDVVGTASDGLEALTKARELRPDVILMDIQMPNCNGLSATRLIKAELPEIKIIILTISESDEDLFEAIRSGASGYLLKTLDATSFLNLLAGLERGETPLSPGLTARLLHEFARQSQSHPALPPETSATVRQSGSEAGSERDETPQKKLSARQIEVLTLIAEGLTYKAAGDVLGLTERTIKYHMGEILRQLRLKNRSQVIAYAARVGLVRGQAGQAPPDG